MSNNDDEVQGTIEQQTTTSIRAITEGLSQSLPTSLEFSTPPRTLARCITEQRRPISRDSSIRSREEIDQLVTHVWEAENIKGVQLLESYQECVRRSQIDALTSV